MKSINKTMLIGIVGKDPEIRYTQQGMAIANFSLATNKKNKDNQNLTQWHNIVAFAKTAELVEKYVRKGSKLYVEGEIQYQDYEKDGIKRTFTKIAIHDMSFLSYNDNQPSSQDKQKAHGNDSPSFETTLMDNFQDCDIPF